MDTTGTSKGYTYCQMVDLVSFNLQCFLFGSITYQDYPYPGQPEVATDLPLIGTSFTLPNIEVLKSVTLLLHFFQACIHTSYIFYTVL